MHDNRLNGYTGYSTYDYTQEYADKYYIFYGLSVVCILKF